MIIFDAPGPDNTDRALAAAYDAARGRGIRTIVVASTRGETARKAIAAAAGSACRLIVVTHNTGFAAPGGQRFDPAIRQEAERAGHQVHTGTMPLRGLGRSLRDTMGYAQEEVVAQTLRMVCQGVKVCCEMAAMVSDAGLVPPDEDIICVAGTGQGADTACIMKPQSSNRFFDIRVREILAQPRTP